MDQRQARVAIAVMIYKIIRIRLCISCNLIFFAFPILFGCFQKTGEVTIVWKDDKAIGISVPKDLIKNKSDSVESFTVHLAKENAPAIIGSYSEENNTMIFEPLIPFTRGLNYKILLNKKHLEEVKIPEADPANIPELLAIYPAKDTLPENLLKMHFQFSKPMREGQSIQYLTLLEDNKDTLKETFLNLQPELWSEDGTTLTLWLDPGRIKRDLLPNQQLGTPLKEDMHYNLIVSGQWRDQSGLPLTKSFQKEFITTKRDSLSPNPNTWTIHAPKSDTYESLMIDFHESLDYNLIRSSLQIFTKDNSNVAGKWKANGEANQITFTPEVFWRRGDYELQVETRLEDLAGNNINRPFDVDVRFKGKSFSSEQMISIPFSIDR
jgi:hypothetical protein